MMSSRLTAVLERTLDAKAAQAADPDATATVPLFDPDRTGTTTGLAPDRRPDVGRLLEPVPGDAGDRDDLDLSTLPTEGSRSIRGRQRRPLLVPAAACVVVATALAGAVVLQDGGGTGTEDADLAVRPLVYGDPPEGWLVPAWVPDGMELWGMDASSSQPESVSEPATIPQLFGDPEAGRAIYVTSFRYSIDPSTVEDVSVRGASGSAGTGWGAAEEDLGNAVRWDERGVTHTALYRGVSRDQAIAVLDSLEWRTDDPLDGFAPPDDDNWSLRAEATSRTTITRDADLLYSEGVPAVDGGMGSGNGLRVHTSTSSAISAGYLETWYLEGTGDGTGPLVTSRDGREVSVYWPDGRSVIAAPDGAVSSLTLDVLERIATSTAVASTADLTALRDATENRIEALPVVATADTAIGAVEVRADQGLARLCLRRSGSTGTDCDTSTFGGSERPDGSAVATAQWTIDGSWTVGVASRGEVPRIFDGSDPSLPPADAGEVPVETTTVDGWTVQVAQLPTGVDSICIGSARAMSCMSRPSG